MVLKKRTLDILLFFDKRMALEVGDLALEYLIAPGEANPLLAINRPKIHPTNRFQKRKETNKFTYDTHKTETTSLQILKKKKKTAG
jgi:hypothetical protein